jgi:hypothetical protein
MANNEQTGKMAISTFKKAFDGGTRPNRFEVTVGALEPLLVKAASMPAESVGILQVPFRGRIAKLPGDRTYAEWVFTTLDGVSPNSRKSLLDWHRKFNNHRSNVVESDILSGNSTEFIDISVCQLDMQGNQHNCVTLKECWPVEVGAIDLSYDTADTLVEFSCTIAYDWIAPGPNGTGQSSGGNSPEPPSLPSPPMFGQ